MKKVLNQTGNEQDRDHALPALRQQIRHLLHRAESDGALVG